eukprot:573407-Pyramimonas_sp.AAC.1
MHSLPRDGGTRAEIPGLRGLTESPALRLPALAKLPRAAGARGEEGGLGRTEGENLITEEASHFQPSAAWLG